MSPLTALPDWAALVTAVLVLVGAALTLIGTLGLLGGALSLGVFGVGGHDLVGRISMGAMLTFAALMMFSIGSLARLSASQLKTALIARCGDEPRLSRRWAPCR